LESPVFSTSVGLLRWAMLMSEVAPDAARRRARPKSQENGSSSLDLENVKNWLKRLLP